MEESSAQALHHSTGDITTLVMECLDAYGIGFGEDRAALLALLNEVDWYVRMVHLTMMAKALCRVDADIFGARWEHIDKTNARARFHAGVDAASVQALFADSKFIVNATQNIASGAHERIPNGFAAKACVVSDDNTFTAARFRDLPSYFGFSWTDPDWEERLVSHLQSDRNYDDELEPAFEVSKRDFDGLKLMQTLLEIAEIVRFSEGLKTKY